MIETKKDRIGYYTSVINSVHQVDRKSWNECANFTNSRGKENFGNPFLSHEFFCCLEDSGSVSQKTGWISQHILLHKSDKSIIGIFPNFLKNHSWGEYIFDHIFAQAWENAGGKYYPKLLSAVPFTPVAGERFLIKNGINKKTAISVILSTLKDLAKAFKVSSAHINFVCKKQCETIPDNAEWLKRYSIQFHWENKNYENFDHFLLDLTSSKRKVIRRERREIENSSIVMEIVKAEDIKDFHADIFYQFYLSTIEKKWGGAYLNKKFWHLLIKNLKNRIVFIFAKESNVNIAGAINLIDNNAIYGRNWGSVKEVKFLHFETCYYQAIDFAIKNGLKTVEAGAQGMHKIQRGYIPKEIFSKHYFLNGVFRRVASNYLESEKKQIKNEMRILEQKSPFRK